MMSENNGMTRRDFAKMSAAAGFAILSSRVASAQSATDTLKVGLLGCGSRGTGALMQMLEGNENVQVTAIADLFQDKTDALKKQLRESAKPELQGKVALDDGQCFVGFDAYQKIMATDIDIIIEGTLPYSRPKHVAAAVEAKKHIFTEKPVASDSKGIRMVMEAARKHKEMGLSFVAGTQRRHQKEYVTGIEKIHNGEIGDLLAMRVYWNGNLPFSHDRKPEWSDFEYRVRNWYGYCWVCGDSIVEQHVHNLDVANWVLKGHPEAVVASGGRSWKPAEEKYGDLYDNFSCDYEYANGVRVFSFSRHWNKSENEVSEVVIGSKKTIQPQQLGEPGNNPYYQEHMDLVASIRGTGPYLHEGQQVAESTLTGIMGRMAAYTGKKVTWDEALNSEETLVPEVWDFAQAYPVRPVPVPGA